MDDGRLKKKKQSLEHYLQSSTITNINGYKELKTITWNRVGTPAEHLRNTQRNNKNKDNKVNKVNNIYIGLLTAYSDNADLRQALRDYSIMRNKIKAPLTERAVTLLLNKLDTLASTEDLKN